MGDAVGRAELALILDRASSLDADRDDTVTMAEAERIAREVGIGVEDFRSALAEVRSARMAGGKILGPDSTLVTSGRVEGGARDHQVRRALLEGQAHLPQYKAEIVQVGDGVWRSTTRNSMVQVSAGPKGTEVVVSESRTGTKASLLIGGTGAGGFVGAQLAALLSTGLAGEVGAGVAIAIAVGGVAGLATGFGAGAAIWRATARGIQARMIQAVSRIRSSLADGEESPDSEGMDGHGAPRS